MTFKTIARSMLAGLSLVGFLGMPAHAEVSEVRISNGYGILYLPLIVMRDQQFLEKRAKDAGLGDIKVNWTTFDGGNVINDAMMAGTLDFAGIGAPGFVTLWAKARSIPSAAVIGVTGMSSTSLWLMSNKPDLKSLKDFTENDKIALPGIKTSLAAVVLEMIAAKEFGDANYAKLDPLTVGLAHPEALVALSGGKTEITAHFSTPPFQFIEAKNPSIHRVLNSVDYLGNMTLDVTFAPKKFVDANPKTTAAFIAAMDDANALIARDKKLAAEIYIRSSKVKANQAEIEEMIADKDAQFSTTPHGLMNLADFMSHAGTIKVKPAKWTDMFVPQLASHPGD